MSVHAGTILNVAGRSVLQRVQTSGLGNVTIPIDTVREVGNTLVVDQVPQEPEFTFTMESFAVDCGIEAVLHGEVSTGAGSAQAAGSSDPIGTEYKWETSGCINVISPWKDPQSFSSGNVVAGHIIPGYYPSKLSYKFGVTADAATTLELRGGAFYYGGFAPTEEYQTGAMTTFTTAEPAVQYRKGGVGGTTFKVVFGVIINGVLAVEGEDYTVTGGGPASSASPATITFIKPVPATAPDGSASEVRVAYFTTGAHAYPDTVHANAVVLPGAVRGRNICVSVASGGSTAWERLYSLQDVTLDASFAITIERELCNDESTGITINGTDVAGTVTSRAKDAGAFLALLKKITGIDTTQELVGWLNLNPIKLKVEIMDPRNPGSVLKTLYVKDAIFDIPGTPARVNQPTDFAVTYRSQSGTYSAFKGAANI